VAQQLPHHLEPAWILIEVDLRGQVPKFVRRQFHAKPPPHGFFDCQSERMLSPRRAAPCDKNPVRLRTDHLRRDLIAKFPEPVIWRLRIFFWCFRRGTQFQLDLSKYKSCQAHFVCKIVSAMPRT
jgi:hypothetical protein